MNINWYPGHMTAAKRMMLESLEAVHMVIEILDARVPYSSKNPDIDLLAKNKKRLIVLNKCDLADKEKVKIWVNHYKSLGFYVVETNISKKGGAAIVNAIATIMAPEVEKAKAKGMTKTLRALVAGIPNAGKSTIINALAGSNRAKTGDRPGVTRGKQWIRVNDYLEFLDTPGILWPKLDSDLIARHLAFTGAIKDQTFDVETLALWLIEDLIKLYPQALIDRYKIKIGEPLEVYDAICKARGWLLRGGEMDYLRGATTIIDEFRGGKLGPITLEMPEDFAK